MEEVSEEDIRYARLQIEEAERRLDSVIERASTHEERPVPASKMEDVPAVVEDEIWELPVPTPDEDAIQGHVQNIITDCQFCIEIAVKAMFKLVGKDHPFSHGISFESGETQGFYHEIPDSFNRKEDITRAIFLTQFWERFYELSKYGVPKLNVRPETIFTADDGERAVDDTIFCVDLAKDLLSHIEEEKLE